jgi:hypothetical protein
MNRARIVVALCTLLSMTACISQERTYFEPSAPTGKVGAYKVCGGTPDFIEFDPIDIKHVGVSMHIIMPYGGRPPALFLMIGKQGTSGVDRAFGGSADTKAWNAWFETPMVVGAPSNVIVIDWAQGHHDEKLAFPGPPYRVVTNDTWNHFFQQTIPLPYLSGDWVEVTLPPLILDGHTLDIPKVHFGKVTRTQVTGINC